MICAGELLLSRAGSLDSIGRYQLEGALQSAHVHRRRTGQANWTEIVQIYDALMELSGSPVVAINRALALAEVQGAAAGLQSLEYLTDDSRLTEYQPFWAARAELLARTGAAASAHQAYEVAIGLERDPAVRRFLQRRQSALTHA
jgi:RNA polymerase sigma-70 factor (ECF subfamily)